jgi:uncharacterized protein (TIRG00374 family)
LKISEAFALTVLRAILPIFFFLLNIPILMFMEIDADSGKFFAEFLKIISLPVAIIIIFLVITLFYPHTIKRSASKFVWWWGRIKFLHMERILHIEERLFHEIDQFSNILWTYLKEKKLMLLSASGWIFLAFLIDYFIALSIMWGFGFHPPVIRVLLLQFLMRPLLFFAPTPGGTGIWDFTYLGFFSMFMPPYLIGVGVLVWRLMMTYLPAMVGTFILTKDIRSDEKMRKLILEKGELPHEIEEIERKLE